MGHPGGTRGCDMMTRRRILRQAQAIVDGGLPEGTNSSAVAQEIRAINELGDWLRGSEIESHGTPPMRFDFFWAGVLERSKKEDVFASRISVLWAGFLDQLRQRPVAILAPVAAITITVILGATVLLGSEQVQDNRCYVDSYEAETGSIVIEQDLGNFGAATVIWVLNEG